MKDTYVLSKMTVPELKAELIEYISMNSMGISGKEYVNMLIDLIIARAAHYI